MPYFIKEIVFALGSIGVALVFVYNSRVMTDSVAMFPRILCALVIVLACLMAHQTMRVEKRGGHAAQNARPPVNIRRIWIFMALVVGYVALVEPLGYFVITPLYIIAACQYLRTASWVTRLCLSVGFPVLVYFLFVRLLHLPMPLGLFKLFAEVMHHGIG